MVLFTVGASAIADLEHWRLWYLRQRFHCFSENVFCFPAGADNRRYTEENASKDENPKDNQTDHRSDKF